MYPAILFRIRDKKFAENLPWFWGTATITVWAFRLISRHIFDLEDLAGMLPHTSHIFKPNSQHSPSSHSKIALNSLLPLMCLQDTLDISLVYLLSLTRSRFIPKQKKILRTDSKSAAQRGAASNERNSNVLATMLQNSSNMRTRKKTPRPQKNMKVLPALPETKVAELPLPECQQGPYPYQSTKRKSHQRY